VEPVLTLRARTPDELDAIHGWVVDSWLEAPLEPVTPDGALRLTLNKAPGDLAAGVPQPRNHRETEWYEEYERPVLACTLTVRHVEEIVTAPDEGIPLSSGLTFDSASRTLAFDHDGLQVRVSRLDLEFAVTTDVVRWERSRMWRVGPVTWTTGKPLDS
jgi:hypothetical protein